MENLFFESWEGLVRVIIITILAYISIILFLRVSGKRTLSKMKAFDFIITVALGSSLATVSLNRTIPLVEGALVFLILIFLQFTITWLSVRFKKLRNIVTGTPSLLFYKGEMMAGVMRRERVTSEDLFEKVREKGFSGLNDIDAIVLETTGDIAIIPSIDESDTVSLDDVRYFPPVKDR